MKMRRLFMIVRASLCFTKVKTISFCGFIALCTALVLAVVAVIVPLWYNMEHKINNHVYNRELTTTFSSADAVDVGLRNIQSLEHVVGTYHKPVTMFVTETSGALFSDYELDYLHMGYTPVVTAGRLFEKAEKDVALVPETIRDFNAAEHKRNEVDGKSLVGKTLVLQDGYGATRKIKIVGAYNTADPIFNGRQILVPAQELLRYNKEANKATENQAFSLKETLRYGVCVDDYKNVEAVQEQAMAVAPTYQENALNFDVETFRAALIILSAILVMFIAMVILGVFLFITSCLKSRTKELALYRSLGYKTKDLFRAIFAEYASLSVVSMLFGMGLAVLINCFLINPYLDNLVGNTIMAMQAEVQPLNFICIFAVFLCIVTGVCIHAANKSNKIDLMVLMRDTA